MTLMTLLMREHCHLHIYVDGGVLKYINDLDIHQSCNQYLFWKLDLHANFHLSQWYRNRFYMDGLLPTGGCQCDPDKNMTDLQARRIDGPLISPSPEPAGKCGNAVEAEGHRV